MDEPLENLATVINPEVPSLLFQNPSFFQGFLNYICKHAIDVRRIVQNFPLRVPPTVS